MSDSNSVLLPRVVWTSIIIQKLPVNIASDTNAHLKKSDNSETWTVVATRFSDSALVKGRFKEVTKASVKEQWGKKYDYIPWT
jgi:hypothetical protein